MRHTLALLVVIVAACGGWRAHDTAAEIAVLGSFVVDHRQTETITRDCRESNPIIGACGAVLEPATYFVLAGVVHVGVAAALPPRLRTAFQSATIGREGLAIYRNDRAGYGITGDRR